MKPTATIPALGLALAAALAALWPAVVVAIHLRERFDAIASVVEGL